MRGTGAIGGCRDVLVQEGGRGGGDKKVTGQTPLVCPQGKERDCSRVLNNGNDAPKEPRARGQRWQRRWHRVPPRPSQLSRCAFQSPVTAGEALARVAPTSPPPPRVPSGARASPEPPPHLGHCAVPGAGASRDRSRGRGRWGRGGPGPASAVIGAAGDECHS